MLAILKLATVKVVYSDPKSYPQNVFINMIISEITELNLAVE